ncbi:MAG: STAS domain-containing protein [Acidobacteriota bacterium]
MALKQYSSSVPIIKLSGLLIVTFQSPPTDTQAKQLIDDLLNAIVYFGPKAIVLDISALEVLDSYLTRVIYDIAKSAKGLGTKTAIVGMRPAVAITLVSMGLETLNIPTFLSVEDVIEDIGNNGKKMFGKRNTFKS